MGEVICVDCGVVIRDVRIESFSGESRHPACAAGRDDTRQVVIMRMADEVIERLRSMRGMDFGELRVMDEVRPGGAKSARFPLGIGWVIPEGGSLGRAAEDIGAEDEMRSIYCPHCKGLVWIKAGRKGRGVS